MTSTRPKATLEALQPITVLPSMIVSLIVRVENTIWKARQRLSSGIHLTVFRRRVFVASIILVLLM